MMLVFVCCAKTLLQLVHRCLLSDPTPIITFCPSNISLNASIDNACVQYDLAETNATDRFGGGLTEPSPIITSSSGSNESVMCFGLNTVQYVYTIGAFSADCTYTVTVDGT